MSSTQRNYTINILGRTLEHLGVQMYKQRDAAIAELVANSWDADAQEVKITIPFENYSLGQIVIEDNGRGMSQEEVQENYLVIGRNTRHAGNNRTQGGRLVMGRKGIGKLAGFGIATQINLTTWKDGEATKISLDIQELKSPENAPNEKSISGQIFPTNSDFHYPSGTKIILNNLKHGTRLDVDNLHQSLSRRFGRSVKGSMKIYINGEELREYEIDSIHRVPSEVGAYETFSLEDGNEIKFWYAITDKVIHPSLIQGFSVLVRGKIAQKPPYYFGVENTASHQHGTKYFSGEIIADFLDNGTDDDSDLISTDRQEIEWDSDQAQPLKAWGEKKVRAILEQIYKLGGDNAEKNIFAQDPYLEERINRLDKPSRKTVGKLLRVLGSNFPAKEDLPILADQLVRAFEFRYFHDLVEEIEKAAGNDPLELQKLLKHMSDWKTLESRAMLELISGRVGIIDTLQGFLVNDVPEVASKQSDDNLHDLVAKMPWLFDPAWELYGEEKTISKQLKEWFEDDLPSYKSITEEMSDSDLRMRYDFLALKGKDELIVIEIKRSGHPLELTELQRLETYMSHLSRAHTQRITGMLIYGGTHNISQSIWDGRLKDPNLRIVKWADLHETARSYYEHYRAVLEGDASSSGFAEKTREAQAMRAIKLRGTVRRSKTERAMDEQRRRSKDTDPQLSFTLPKS